MNNGDYCGKAETNPTFETMRRFIDENFLNGLSLDRIAEHCYANKFYLSHLFSEKEGVTIQEYILRKKTNYAKKLLTETTLSINEISEKAAFCNCGYFCCVFKKLNFCTPLAFRNSFLVSNKKD